MNRGKINTEIREKLKTDNKVGNTGNSGKSCK
jgi:hypothetical protein